MSFAARGRASVFACGCVLAVGCGAGDPFELGPDSGGSGGEGGAALIAGKPGAAGELSSVGGVSHGGTSPFGGTGAASGFSSANGGREDGGMPAAAGNPSMGGGLFFGGSGGAEPPMDLGGGGHGGSSPDCDDDNACTNDVLLNDGACLNRALSCAAAGQCRRARCEPSTGTCVIDAETDGTPCDDGNVCTAPDGCRAGVCQGTPGAGRVDIVKDVMRDIPDGIAKCGGIAEPIGVVFEVPSSAPTLTNVTSIVVDVDFSHGYVAELDILLRHEPSGRSAYLFEHPNTPEVRADGAYSFADGAAAYLSGIQQKVWLAGSYAPAESLADAFQGVPSAGTWTLTIGDRCGEDTGFLRRARLRLAPTCP